jgi:glycosyltransferase involved in cell wall biosynthesis
MPVQQVPLTRLRVLHAIHDFLPRHRAGSEIYAFELCRELMSRHHVTVVCAEYDPTRRHGHVEWRVHGGLAVVEIVNNWACGSFADTYRPAVITEQLDHVLHAVQPDVLHVHNLLNLSFDLPALARARGIPVVATLHDYTLVCASGGQRVHRAERHVCYAIDADRCARCFPDSPFSAQASLAGMASLPGPVTRAAMAFKRRVPRFVSHVARAAAHAPGASLRVSRADIEKRLEAAREVFNNVDLFVAPSSSIASEFAVLGLERAKIRVLDYGFPAMPRPAARKGGGPLRIGYVGTLVWHKGVHVLIDAVRRLQPDMYELHVFGSVDTHPEYAREIQAAAAGCPVQFHGGFDPVQLPEVYGRFDVLAVPSIWLENSPLVIHEAYMAGVPVVGSRIGGIVDLVKDGVNGLLCEPGSPDDLARVLSGLARCPERLAELSRELPAVRSIDEDARGWEAIYTSAIERRAVASW